MADARTTPRREQARKMAARAAVVGLLMALHAALFLALNPQFPVPVAERAREIVLLLPQRAPKPQLTPTVAPGFAVPRIAVPFPPVFPPIVAPETETPLPNVTGLGRSLFGCDLANGQNLPPDQRENCWQASLPPSAPEIGMPKKSHAVESARWVAELAARRIPPAVPCAHVETMLIGTFGAQKRIGAMAADPLCLLNGLLNGFGQPK